VTTIDDHTCRYEMKSDDDGRLLSARLTCR
jgi:hypothetical protein